MRTPRRYLKISLLVIALVVSAIAQQPTGAGAPSVERLRAHIEYLASDKLEGRRTGSAGGIAGYGSPVSSMMSISADRSLPLTTSLLTPPSPGCVVPHNPLPPSASGIPYAAIWQFERSPRPKEFTARCAATYNADGNCYAPGDIAHAWFLDLNSAATSDPSHGGN